MIICDYSNLNLSGFCLRSHKTMAYTIPIGCYTMTIRPSLGSGAFGAVYKAKHNETGEVVAVKELNSEFMRESFEHELDIIKRLQNHQHIVRLIDHIITQTNCYLIMEFCDLNHLEDYFKKNPTLDQQKRIELMKQSADGLAYIHTQSPPIVHRDIKPTNLLMKTESGNAIVKIDDFGVSKLFESQMQTSLHTDCGTEYYKAPEFFSFGDEGLRYKSGVDVYALGLVFAEMMRFGAGSMQFLPLSGKCSFIKVCFL